MHIDHQIVFRTPDLFEQIEKAQHRPPLLPALREIAPRKKDHVRERGMMAHDLRVFRGNKPVNPRLRIARAQLDQHRDRVHDVAQRRRLDQQNARELSRLQGLCVTVFRRCVFDLIAQSAKDNQQE